MKATKQNEARDRVLDLIEQLSVGDAIPSERQLSADLGFSRLTVRAALDELVREGYLVRRRGSGTFVSEPKIAQELTMTSFTEDMRRRGMTPGSRTLELRLTPAGARLGRVLNASPSERIVVAKRLRLADRETMAIETLHVREAHVPGLTGKDLEHGSFYELLRSRYGIVIVGGIQTIEPTVTGEEESEALGVPLHSPAFLFERVTHSESGKIVEYVRSIYRGDRYRLVTELSHSAEARRPRTPRSGSGARDDGLASTTVGPGNGPLRWQRREIGDWS
jgi:GntR family transcriptional regulator